jgi:ubiquitin-conjugating enzyme E2 J1
MSKSPSLRRIQADIRELSLDPSDQYYAAPLENDMFEWHFTIRGAPETDFVGGLYHGRILLPPDYPFKPPHIVFLTPSGRFETNTKICLSFSAFHPELWQPAWGIRLILEALISFLPTAADGAIGALAWSAAERKRLAKKSVDYCCPLCGKVADLLPKVFQAKTSAKSRFQKEIEQLQRLQTQEHIKKTEGAAVEADEDAALEAAKGPSEQGGGEKDDGTDEVLAMIEDSKPEASTPTTDPNEAPPVVAETAVTPATMTTTTTTPTTPIETVTPPIVVPVVEETKPSWLAEPVLHMATLVLSIICLLLIRKIQALCAELRELVVL